LTENAEYEVLPVAEYAHIVVPCNHARLAGCFLNKGSSIYADQAINEELMNE